MITRSDSQSGCGSNLEEIPGVEVFGHRDNSRRVGTLSFRSESLPATELGGILDQAFDIAIRPGLHCAPYTHKALGTFPDGTVRVSPGPFNTEADIDRLAGALREILLKELQHKDTEVHTKTQRVVFFVSSV